MLVYKYRGSFTRDLKSLKNDTFWASNTSQLNDPCEGLILIDDYKKQIEILKQTFSQYPSSLDSFEKNFQDIIKMKDNKLGIFSLSKNFNDELLWAHYANSHKGFCIEYHLPTLLKNQLPPFRSFDVSYSNDVPNLSLTHIISQKDADLLIKNMLGYKSKRWEYENELRIITENFGLNSYDYRAVKAIYFGLKTPESTISKTMKALKGRTIKYYRMSLKPSSFELIANEIEDRFPTLEKYKYSIAPIAESAIDSSRIKVGYESFIPFLHKLAEIVRREPDCIEVEYIDLSNSKSTPTSPVFFAQYKTQENDWLTHTVHYTLEEIDSAYKKIDDLK